MTLGFKRTMRITSFARNIVAVLATGAFVTSILIAPAKTLAASPSTPRLETTFGVANNSTSDTTYRNSVNAAQGQMVQIQLYYVNKEAADSGKVAESARAKITLPDRGSQLATVTSSLQSEGGAPVTNKVNVSTDRDDSRLQYVPGSAVWKHNTGTAAAPKYVESKLSDEIVTSPSGLVIEDQKPGEAFGSTVTIRARVGGNGVKVTAQTQAKGQTGQWSSNNLAKPGDAMRMLIGYQNTTAGDQNNVSVRADLTKDAQLTLGTTMITNAAQPNGVMANTEAIDGDGINIGNYKAGTNAYVAFEFTLPAADRLTCGDNKLQNTGVVGLNDGSEYYATAITKVTRDCPTTGASATSPAPAAAPAATDVGTDSTKKADGNADDAFKQGAAQLQDQQDQSKLQTPATPAYSCDSLTVAKLDGRKIEATVKYTAGDGTSLKSITYNFGDKSTPLTTDKTTVQYTYAADGTYTVAAGLSINVSDKIENAVSDACTKTVTFAPAADTAALPPAQTAAPASLNPPTPPASPTPSATAPAATPAPSPAPATTPAKTVTPSALPNSGPGNVVAVFIVTAIAGTVAHRLYLGRRARRYAASYDW